MFCDGVWSYSDTLIKQNLFGLLTMNKSLDNFHVVLVETIDNLNIGSVARAMMNLGYKHLHLVAPKEFSAERAKITARTSIPLIEEAIIHDTLEDALREMEYVVGFTARDGKNRFEVDDLPLWSASIPSRMRKTALVFGPENNGLQWNHLQLCQSLVSIPANPHYSSFNLAQAALLVMYEISRTLSETSTQKNDMNAEERATWGEYQQLDILVNKTLSLSNFYKEDTPGSIPGIIKRIWRRTELDPREMRILLGIFGRVSRTLERYKTP